MMAHGAKREGKGGIGSRRIFAPHFKLQVLDSYRNDADCKGNQRATARKYGIHRRQIQKWLQVEHNLRSSVGKEAAPPPPPSPPPAPMDLSLKPPSAPWDLSTKPRPPEPKPLFKPYLDVERREPQPCCACCCGGGEAYTLHELQPAGYYYALPPPEPFDLKQRHSYSLDFKLAAVECYYQDAACRGNQRAVASKYNVHRRQVQKWLKQADELRQRSDQHHTQAVR